MTSTCSCPLRPGEVHSHSSRHNPDPFPGQTLLTNIENESRERGYPLLVHERKKRKWTENLPGHGGKRIDIFGILHAELVVLVLEELEVRELVALAGVCRGWREYMRGYVLEDKALRRRVRSEKWGMIEEDGGNAWDIFVNIAKYHHSRHYGFTRYIHSRTEGEGPSSRRKQYILHPNYIAYCSRGTFHLIPRSPDGSLGGDFEFKAPLNGPITKDHHDQCESGDAKPVILASSEDWVLLNQIYCTPRNFLLFSIQHGTFSPLTLPLSTESDEGIFLDERTTRRIQSSTAAFLIQPFPDINLRLRRYPLSTSMGIIHITDQKNEDGTQKVDVHHFPELRTQIPDGSVGEHTLDYEVAPGGAYIALFRDHQKIYHAPRRLYLISTATSLLLTEIELPHPDGSLASWCAPSQVDRPGWKEVPRVEIYFHRPEGADSEGGRQRLSLTYAFPQPNVMEPGYQTLISWTVDISYSPPSPHSPESAHINPLQLSQYLLLGFLHPSDTRFPPSFGTTTLAFNPVLEECVQSIHRALEEHLEDYKFDVYVVRFYEERRPGAAGERMEGWGVRRMREMERSRVWMSGGAEGVGLESRVLEMGEEGVVFEKGLVVF